MPKTARTRWKAGVRWEKTPDSLCAMLVRDERIHAAVCCCVTGSRNGRVLIIIHDNKDGPETRKAREEMGEKTRCMLLSDGWCRQISFLYEKPSSPQAKKNLLKKLLKNRYPAFGL